MDTLNLIYLVAFVAGATFTAFSFFFGGGGDHATVDGGGDGGADADADAGHLDGGDGGHVDAHADGSHADGSHADGSHADGGEHTALAPHTVGPGLSNLFTPLLSLYAISALCCLGGGAGLLVRWVSGSTLTSLLVALPVGIAGAYVIGGFMTWLKRNTRYQARFDPVGTVANVIATCSATRVGEILFVREGKRCSMPARASDERTIATGTEVIITEVNGGIARVAVASEWLATTKEA